MKVSNWGALASAIVFASITAPAAARAQGGAPAASALSIVGAGAHIGVTVHDADSGSGKEGTSGVVIETVTPEGPADKAGMKAGDTLAEFDGERVRSSMQLTRLVRETPDGRKVQAVLMRGGQRVTVTVTPEATTFRNEFPLRLLEATRPRLATSPLAPEPPAPPRTPRPPAMLAPTLPLDLIGRLRGGRLGVTIEDLDSQLAQYFGVKDGVLVRSVAEGSAGAKAGLKAGDVITAVNGRHVYETSDLTRALDRIENDGDLTIEVSRDRKTQTLKGKLEPRETRVRTRTRATV